MHVAVRRAVPRRSFCKLVLIPLLGAPLAGPAMPAGAQATGGSISGRVIDGLSDRPLPGSIVTLGYETLQLATVTDGAGRYRFADLPAQARVDVIAFRAGYTYLLRDHALAAGQQLTVDFSIIPEPNPGLVPTISNPLISPDQAAPGQSVTFSMDVRQGSEVPLSPEVIVMNPVLGRMVLLRPSGGDRWAGSFTVPRDLAPGAYEWTFFAVDQACREPVQFPVRQLTITDPRTVSRVFPETGKTVPGVFLQYWSSHGGLPIFGLPISDAIQERSPSDGQTYTVQYFERARFELHPEFAGTEHEVLLGLLGRQVTAGREDEPPFRRVPPLPDTPERRYFEPTGHTLAGGFKSYWDRQGGLARFGYPISEEFAERNQADGQVYTVQYFERARFEYHPEFQGTPHEVLLGHLGRQIFERR
jgi:hypothetical protein